MQEKRIDDSKKLYEKAYEDMIGNRIMLSIIVGFVALMLLMYVYRGFSGSKIPQMYQLAKWMSWGSGIVTVAGAVWYFVSRKNRMPGDLKVITPENVTLTALLFTLGSMAVHRYDVKAVQALFLIVPCIVGLYFVGRVFPKDFTVACVFGAIGVLWLYGMKGLIFTKGLNLPMIIIFHLGFAPNQFAWVLSGIFGIYLVLMALALIQVKRTGRVQVGKFRLELGKQANVPLMAIALVLPLAIMVLTYVVRQTSVCQYGMFAIGAYLLVCGLWYTYRMMNNK